MYITKWILIASEKKSASIEALLNFNFHHEKRLLTKLVTSVRSMGSIQVLLSTRLDKNVGLETVSEPST